MNTLGRRNSFSAAIVAVVATLLLSGCSPGFSTGDVAQARAASSPPSNPPLAAHVGRYVAMGDSFQAGPYIPTTQYAAGCLRSNHNYPHLLAARLHVARLVDVTCSGAQTANMTRRGSVPAQLDAVTADTDLVTIGIGGNDLALYSTLVRLCTSLRASDPTGAPCARRLAAQGFDLEKATILIRDRVEAVLRDIRRRAPGATVLVVGYLRLAPERGTCAALPLATGDYVQGRKVFRALRRAQRQAARRAGADFVDLYTASRGHDICSAAPWVNGSRTDPTRALAYHPLAAGMQAATQQVLAQLQRS